MQYNPVDLAILEVVHIKFAHPVLDKVNLALSSDYFFILLSAVIAFMFYKTFGKAFWKYYLFLLATVGFSDAIAAHVLKPFFGRLRPCQVFEEVRIVSGCAGLYSFPSNHAINSMCIAGFIFFLGYKKFGHGLIWAALLVGTSRVYLGVHYPSDILFGFILGIIISYCGVRITAKFLPGVPISSQ